MMAKTPTLTPQEQIAEYRRLAEQLRADAMDALMPDLQKKIEKQAEDFERLADELERKP